MPDSQTPAPSSQPDHAMDRIRAQRWRTRAQRELPSARLEPGAGPWISVSECMPQVVHFHADEQTAQRAVDQINDSGCGGKGCQGRASLALVAAHWSMPLD